MIGMLVWKPHLGTLANSLVMLLVMGWLFLLWIRYRTRYSVSRSLLLLAPKFLCTLLVLIALMDPVWREARPDENQTVAVITDISSSMDVPDHTSGSRAKRADKIVDKIESKLRGKATVVRYQFDVDMLKAEEKPAKGTRQTDLGRTFVSISEPGDLSISKAVVLLTDGGDEAVRSERLPPIPVYIVGVGTDPSTWDDLEIGNADIPEEVELDTPFKVSAEIVVHSASKAFASKLESVDVQIEKLVNGEYQPALSEKVDPRKNNGRVTFNIPGESKEGLYQYRLVVKSVRGEMTELNNQRDFVVDVREKSINVLLYGNLLDWDFANIKKELGGDPTIQLTSVFRKNKDVFVVSGARQDGDTVLAQGLPADEKALGLYTIIVLGSFHADLLKPSSLVALKKYVEDGGNLVLLGGAQSFGKGGYYQTDLAPLIPWKQGSHPGISSGVFPVIMPPEADGHGLSAATAAIMKRIGSPTLASVNKVGPQRSGALSLMNASAGKRILSVVALQQYGKGQTLGIATDTLWRWGRMDGEISTAFHQFWRDTIRYLSGDFEDGKFLSVAWDRKRYRVGEQAIGEIKVVGRYAEGAVRVTGAVEYEGETAELPVVLESQSDFETKVFFGKAGEYTVTLDATLSGEPLDTYERIIHVGSSVSEGSDLAVDHPYLDSLASRSGGSYSREDDTEVLLERLDEMLEASSDMRDTPVVRMAPLFNVLPAYIIILMGILLWEWILRRRMNIV